MSYEYKSSDVKCPFFIREDKYSITCEGCLGQNNRTTKFSFRTVADKLFHKRNWCERKYKYCEYYDCIMKARYEND